MKRISVLISQSVLFAAVFFTAACKETIEEPVTQVSPLAFSDSSRANLKNSRYQAVLDKYVKKGLPGVVTAILTPKEGIWLGASGYARLENKEPMQPNQIHYLASVTKMYTATAIMLLVERGKINLDEKMSAYIPGKYWTKLTNGDRITVRQLLNHTSGLHDYTESTQFISDAFNDYTAKLTADDYIAYVYSKPSLSEPGAEWHYSNVNYILLAKIIDYVTGEDHSRFISSAIIQKLGLQNTYYKNEAGYPKPKGLVNSYMDRYGNKTLENASDVQNKFTESFIGEDGVLASSYNMALFIKALFSGKLVKSETLQTMMTWKTFPQNSLWDGYGLGLGRRATNRGYCIGHSGSLIGTQSALYYFPDRNIAIATMTNVGQFANSPYETTFKELFNELIEVAVE
jgi:D-alanyl-D-alanine carboxypeptidase